LGIIFQILLILTTTDTMKHLNLWLIIANLIFNLTATSQAEQRIALVIGNADYLDGSNLKNPVNDAEDLSKVLRHLGFEVILKTNLSQQKMETVVSEFGQKLSRDKDTVGLFYFSGHGVQHNGKNYLIPIGGMALNSPQQLPYETVNANYVLDEMKAAKNQMNIVILDACRYNIFKSKFKGKRERPGDPGGLAAPQQTPTGFLIAYATAANDFASDFVKDGDRNSPYLKHLKCQMQKHNLMIEQMFKQVRVAVKTDTEGSQAPTYYAAMDNDFFFVPQGSRIEAIQECAALSEGRKDKDVVDTSLVKPSFFEKAWEISSGLVRQIVSVCQAIVAVVILILLIWIGWRPKNFFKKAWKNAVTKRIQLKVRKWWNQLDNNWKNVFKEAINIKSEPSDDELVKIVNLQTLDCRDNKISDLEPLGDLTNLQELYCEGNQISDLKHKKLDYLSR